MRIFSHNVGLIQTDSKYTSGIEGLSEKKT